MTTYRKGQTVLVAHDMTTPGQKTTVGTVARIVSTKAVYIGAIHPEGWYVIETFDHKYWTVHPSDIVKAPRPWSFYEQTSGHFDNSLEVAALAAAEGIDA